MFVDRDGVINELVADPVTGAPESPLRVADVRLLSGAAEALRELAAAGWELVGVSNQPAAAKGTITLDELWAIQGRVLGLLEQESVSFADFRICVHHPDGVVDGLRRPCECRKPAPGMLLAAARTLGLDLTVCWMIGDTDSDVAAGRAAGCATILLSNPRSAHKRSGGAIGADFVAPNLSAAAALILRGGR